MSVHFISGKPGGGKTLYAVKLIIEELLHGTRPIYTNISLNPGRLSEYLQAAYPSRDINLLDRLHILDDDTETPKFWTIRPGRPVIEVLNAGQWSQGQKPKYNELQDHGVFYAIDEIHNFFNARAWQETGRDVLFYLSQHRKLGDTVICVTQAIGNVDKQFRSVTQDFTYLRNLNKERMGLFRLPSVFIRRTYGSPATDTMPAMESGTFTLDVSGIASCYNTAQGVSIHGKSADLKERKTGLNVLYFAIGLPALLLLIVFAVPKLGAHYFSPDKRVAEVQAKTAKAVQPKKAEPESYHVATNESSQKIEHKYAKTNAPLVCVGYTRINGPWTAMLSDGESYTMENGLEEISKTYVVVMGIRYRMAKPKEGEPMEFKNYTYAPAYAAPVTPGEVQVTVLGERASKESRPIAPISQRSQISY